MKLWEKGNLKAIVLAAMISVLPSEQSNETSQITSANATASGIVGAGAWVSDSIVSKTVAASTESLAIANSDSVQFPDSFSTDNLPVLPAIETGIDKPITPILPPLAQEPDLVIEGVMSTPPVDTEVPVSDQAMPVLETDIDSPKTAENEVVMPDIDQETKISAQTERSIESNEGETFTSYDFVIKAGDKVESRYRQLVDGHALSKYNLPQTILDKNANLAWSEFINNEAALKSANLENGPHRVFPGDSINLQAPLERFDSLNQEIANKLQLPNRTLVTKEDVSGIGDVLLRTFGDQLSMFDTATQKDIIVKSYTAFASEQGSDQAIANALDIAGSDPDFLQIDTVINVDPLQKYIYSEIESRHVESNVSNESSETSLQNNDQLEDYDQATSAEVMTPDKVTVPMDTPLVISDTRESLTAENYPGGIETYLAEFNQWLTKDYAIKAKVDRDGWLSNLFEGGSLNEEILFTSIGDMTAIAQIDDQTELRLECEARGFSAECFQSVYNLLRHMRADGTLPSDDHEVRYALSQSFLMSKNNQSKKE